MGIDDQGSGAEPRSRERTRERLIEAAFEVFAEQGVAAPSVETIVERAGFTRGAFYSNFDSKTELFFAIADKRYADSAAGLQASVDAIFAEVLPPGAPLTSEAVEAAVTQALALTHSDSTWTLFESEFEALALRDPDIAARYAGHHRAVVDGLSQLLAGALERIGLHFTLPAGQATRMLIAGYTAAVKQHVLAGGTGQVPASALVDVSALAYLLTARDEG